MDAVAAFQLNQGARPVEPANDNVVVMNEGATPAEALQSARLTKEWLVRRAVRDPKLLWDAEWRFTWQITLAFERCVVWRYLEHLGLKAAERSAAFAVPSFGSRPATT